MPDIANSTRSRRRVAAGFRHVSVWLLAKDAERVEAQAAAIWGDVQKADDVDLPKGAPKRAAPPPPG